MKRVLIASVSAGSGHVRAAEAVQTAAQQWFPEVKTHHVDVMKYVSRSFKWIYSDGYSFAVDRAPFLWKKIYKMTDGEAAERKVKPAINAIQRRHAQEFLDYVQHFDPEAILSTHFLIPQLLADDVRAGRVTPRLECVITDYDLHRIWIHDSIQKYHVAHEGLADKLVYHGVPISKINVTGIPIHPIFTDNTSVSRVMRELTLEPGRPVLLVLSGGAGLRSLERTVHELFQVRLPLQILTVSGTNQKLKNMLDRMKPPPQMRMRNLGFVSNMHELLSVADAVVTKAGGLTVSECLAKHVPMIFYAPIPGQEERNAAFVESIGAGMLAKSAALLKVFVQNLLQDRHTLSAMRTCAGNYATPQAAYRVASTFISPVVAA